MNEIAELSPFIADTKLQYAWDSTSLGWLKECARKYQYSMIEGWRARSTRIDLEFGIAYHSGIERYEKRKLEGYNHTEALRAVVRFALKDSKNWPKDLEPPKTRETLLRSLIWYLEEFRDDNARTILLANSKPAVELSFRYAIDFAPNKITGYEELWPQYVLCGHIDRLVEFAGQSFVMDHKTTKVTLSSSYFDQYEPDNQMTLYTLASQVVFSTPVKGVLIDAAQIAVGFTRFERHPTFRTEGQLEEWLGDLRILLRQNEEYVRNNYWPMNDKSCRLCPFKKICSKDPSVRERFLEAEFVRQPWNPLRVR